MIGFSWGLFGDELKRLRIDLAKDISLLADKIGCDINQIENLEQKKKFLH